MQVLEALVRGALVLLGFAFIFLVPGALVMTGLAWKVWTVVQRRRHPGIATPQNEASWPSLWKRTRRPVSATIKLVPPGDR